MAAELNTVTLNNGVTMPTLAFGTFQVPDPIATRSLQTAFASGYRSVDTAAIYGNEHGVGQAIAASGVPREDLFVITKLWNADHGHDETMRAFEQSLSNLGLDYVDLYLIHWPAPRNGLYSESWRAMDELHRSGLARAIGVSNFLPEHLERIADLGLTVPAVNQIEVHPTFANSDGRSANTKYGILTQAWAPLAHSRILGNPVVNRIAHEHGRTPAQVVLRWHLQQGRPVIPKSVTPARIVENSKLFDFELSPADVASIDTLDRGARMGPDPNLLH
ncbi:aldo/keto reductase [Streptomyces sp. SID13031]|uniref:aldo/keto reductase n=1 Tax=Streptomyces sp. SID13031 TaxID=2706046 RepID=UPI0013C613CF|nr:aldo/keto reductase [Streptomyces sp. SID13031]NEA31325.1 aldo/keto reductase [Streptomyces sp. SID13031]